MTHMIFSLANVIKRKKADNLIEKFKSNQCAVKYLSRKNLHFIKLADNLAILTIAYLLTYHISEFRRVRKKTIMHVNQFYGDTSININKNF